MKKVFTTSFIRALIITVISALIIVGGIYAYQTLWSGKARITIEEPPSDSEANVEIMSISSGKGTWEEATKTWTVSLKRGENTYLTIELKNTGNDVARVRSYIDGAQATKQIAPGVALYFGHGLELTIPAGGGQNYVAFGVSADATAQSGTFPNVSLEIKVE